jgi:hypothetical protein
LLFLLAVLAVISLLFSVAGFKKPEVLRSSEVQPLYFPGIISGISERGHPKSQVGGRSVALRRRRNNALHQNIYSEPASPGAANAGNLCRPTCTLLLSPVSWAWNRGVSTA